MSVVSNQISFDYYKYSHVQQCIDPYNIQKIISYCTTENLVHCVTTLDMIFRLLYLSGAPSTTSHLDINILSILHNLGSPLG